MSEVIISRKETAEVCSVDASLVHFDVGGKFSVTEEVNAFPEKPKIGDKFLIVTQIADLKTNMDDIAIEALQGLLAEAQVQQVNGSIAKSAFDHASCWLAKQKENIHV